MSTDNERWKDKYLASLEQQERLESRWEARLDLLRRGLVRSSLAAEGADKAVDQCMQDLRAILRKNDIDAGLSNLIPHLERTVLDSEKQRKLRSDLINVALTALVDQLFRLDLPRDVAKPLKAYAKKLERSGEHFSDIPALLTELSNLQRQALAALEREGPARPGLIQRLFGGREQTVANAEPMSEPASPVQADADLDTVQLSHASAAEPLQSATSNAQLGTELATELAAGPEHAAEFSLAVESRELTGESVASAEAAVLVVDEPLATQPDAAIDPAMIELAPELPAADGEPSAELIDVEQGDAENSEALDEPALADESGAQPQALDAVLIDLPEVAPIAEPQELAPAEPLAGSANAEGAPEDSQPADAPIAEPVYSAIADHVETTLLGLLAELPLPAHHQPQAESLSQRIRAGLNMYELVPVLDDLAVLMRVIADIGQREFEGYLKQLNERLATFQGSLKDTQAGYTEAVNSERALDSELREQVDGLNVSVQEATDLTGLKGLVDSRLSGLLGTMAQYQTQRDEREQQVNQRLQALVERVASMEQEATGFRDHIEEQRQKALIDSLTGLPNRAAWSERLELELARWQRYNGELLLAVIDIDHFKRINDAYGHLAGDKVLKIIAGELHKRVRKTDFIARFGGEEFVVLLPSTPLDGGLQLLETLRNAIEQCPFHFKGEPVTITLSAGIAAFNPGDRADAVFERADQALYRAKHQGRNRIEQG